MTGRCWSPATWRRMRWPNGSAWICPRTATTRRSPGWRSTSLKRLPAEGESFEEQGWRFEVVDLDGRRIDKLLVSRQAE